MGDTLPLAGPLLSEEASVPISKPEKANLPKLSILFATCVRARNLSRECREAVLLGLQLSMPPTILAT